MIEFLFEDVDSIGFNEEILTNWIIKVIESHNFILGDLTYIFCSDNYILNVNKEYLQHDYYTDIITFNYCEENIISGDLFISLDTVKSNSDLYGVDFQIEWYRVIIHGVLHLIGFDDKSDEQQSEMTKMEDSCLLLLETIS